MPSKFGENTTEGAATSTRGPAEVKQQRESQTEASEWFGCAHSWSMILGSLTQAAQPTGTPEPQARVVEICMATVGR